VRALLWTTLLGSALLIPEVAHACPSCSVHTSSAGRVILVIALIAAPIVVAAIGIAAVRRILKTLQS
jgi:hypothetical protein